MASYLFLINLFWLFLFSIVLTMYYVLSLKLCLYKMEQDLEDWISFGTGDDIVRCRDQRQEYDYYVKLCQNDDTLKINIPANVIKKIRADIADDSFFKLIYLKLTILKLKRYKF